jgi:hypothetical protein
MNATPNPRPGLPPRFQDPSPAIHRGIVRRLFVLAYGIWLLSFPLHSSATATDSYALPLKAFDCVVEEQDQTPLPRPLIGRRRTLLRSLRTLAGLRSGTN